MCVSSVRYRFLRNPLTEFDETLHALYTLPKNDVRPKKFRFRKFFSNFFFNFMKIARASVASGGDRRAKRAAGGVGERSEPPAVGGRKCE